MIEEEKTNTGSPTISGFSNTHINESLRSIYEFAETKNTAHRTMEARLEQAIGAMWKYGLYTLLGNVKRDISPAEVCPLIKKLSNCPNLRKQDQSFLGSISRSYSYSSRYAGSKARKRFISMDTLKRLREVVKHHKL